MQLAKVGVTTATLILLTVSCATGISTVENSPDCPVVGHVRETFDVVPMYAMLGYTIGEMEAKRKAQLKAEEMGATHVKWTRVDKHSLAVWVTGTAYRCEAE